MKSSLHYDDAELIARIKNGDRGAFDIVYNQHWLKLYRVARRITDDEATAEDIIQEAFISFWEKGAGKDIKSISGYLYQTVKFLCFMHLRAGSISKKNMSHFAAIAAEQQLVSDEYSYFEMQTVVEECIASLPEKCREVFRLSRVEELSNKKIAEKLHISPKTVENQITKALRQLRFSLDKLALIALLCVFSS
jgi:RNA polymerase sigma-70 factor (ECF subfamily)